MNWNVVIDWKFVVALGAATAGIILASKMDSAAAERVSTVAVVLARNWQLQSSVVVNSN